MVLNAFPNSINYEVQLLESGKDKSVVHASNMKLYNEPHKTHLSKRNTDDEAQEEQPEFEVEQVIDRRRHNNELQYLVKWKRFGPNDNTWEPMANLIHSRDEVKKFEQRRKAAAQTPVATQN